MKIPRDFEVYRWPGGHVKRSTGEVEYEWGILVAERKFISCGVGDEAHDDAYKLYAGMHKFLNMLERMYITRPDLMEKVIDND